MSLYSSAKLLPLPYSSLRLTVSATFAALWGIIFLFYPYLAILHIPVAWLAVLIMSGKRKSIKGTIFFILSEMAIGGMILGIRELLYFVTHKNGGLALITIICVAISFVIYDGFELYIKNRIYSVSISTLIKHSGKKKRLLLLIDSGNLAREISTGRRIIFVKGDFENKIKAEKPFAIPIKTATGTKIKYGFIPDTILFDDKKYNNEKYILVPDTEGCDFGGYDGIIGVV